MHLKEYKLRKELNKEMYSRIHQAKANFLDITGTAAASIAVAVHVTCTTSPARHAELHRHCTSRLASHTVHLAPRTSHLAPRS
eukprot:scaffold75095_cov63-Phaeocystis_antarctica.AAC.2